MEVMEETAAMEAQEALVVTGATAATEETEVLQALEAMAEMAEMAEMGAMEETEAPQALAETAEMEATEATEAMAAALAQEAMEETEATVEMAAMEATEALAPLEATEAHPLHHLPLLLLLATSSLRLAMVRSKHPLATLNLSLRPQTAKSRLLPEVPAVLRVLLPLVSATRPSLLHALDLNASSRLLHHPPALQLLLPTQSHTLVLLQASAFIRTCEKS